MPVPDFQSIMLPFLKFSNDDNEHTPREAVEKLADKFNLTDAARAELLPSSTQRIFENRVAGMAVVRQLYERAIPDPYLVVCHTNANLLWASPVPSKFPFDFPSVVRLGSIDC